MTYIDFIVPELYASDGGIQNYSKALIASASKLLPNAKLRVFILNDRKNTNYGNQLNNVDFYAANRNKASLVKQVMQAAHVHRPSLVISTHPNFAILQLAHKKIFQSKYWSTAHGIEVWNIQSRLQLKSLSKIDRLLPVSKYTRDRLKNQLRDICPKQTILPNSFDGLRFCPGLKSKHLLGRYGLAEDTPIILTLSRLSYADRYKNIDRLIESIRFLLPRWPDIRLIVMGDGDDRNRLSRIAKDNGVGPSVIFTGRVETAEIPDHLRLASVFALPSSGEGFGIVFLEALGCGVPVIAGNRDGSSEPLREGKFGQLVDPELPLAPVLASMLSCRGPSLWFQPNALSKAVTDEFGLETFCQRLKMILYKDGIA